MKTLKHRYYGEMKEVGYRVEKNVKNSTDKMFELEILAQKTPAKIRINVQQLAKKMQNVQFFWQI